MLRIWSTSLKFLSQTCQLLEQLASVHTLPPLTKPYYICFQEPGTNVLSPIDCQSQQINTLSDSLSLPAVSPIQLFLIHVWVTMLLIQLSLIFELPCHTNLFELSTLSPSLQMWGTLSLIHIHFLCPKVVQCPTISPSCSLPYYQNKMTALDKHCNS